LCGRVPQWSSDRIGDDLDTHISPQCELANETTADKSLGIAVPDRLLALADEGHRISLKRSTQKSFSYPQATGRLPHLLAQSGHRLALN
jgi:hypothetical protein